MSHTICILVIVACLIYFIQLSYEWQLYERSAKTPPTNWIYLPQPELWVEEEVYIGKIVTDYGNSEFEWTLTVTACSGHPQPRVEAIRAHVLRLTLPTEEKVYRTVVEKRMHHSPIQHPIKTCNKDAPIEHIIRLEDPTNHTRLYIVKATLKHTDGCGSSIRDFNIAMNVNQTSILVRFRHHKHPSSFGWR